MRLALVGLLALGCHAAVARPFLPEGQHERRMAAPVDGHQLVYRLDVPAGERPDDGWPLVLFLHGAGERGDDLARVGVHGPPKLVDTVPELGRCVLVSPQCPAESWWRSAALLALLDEVEADVAVDADRVYVTGLSMGGYGTWNLVTAAPDRFAAAVPICGGGEIGDVWPEHATGFELAHLDRVTHLPIRAVHGDADRVVPPRESRKLVRHLERHGGNATLTLYPGVGHDSWTRTYADPELWAWLFAQRRTTD